MTQGVFSRYPLVVVQSHVAIVYDPALTEESALYYVQSLF